MINENESMQKEICQKYGAIFYESRPDEIAGVALNVREISLPINGLRHPPKGNTTGWYIWGGEKLNDASDFFQPLHIDHLANWCPKIQKYLGLPPGWRFLIAGDYEDVWFDQSLLDINDDEYY